MGLLFYYCFLSLGLYGLLFEMFEMRGVRKEILLLIVWKKSILYLRVYIYWEGGNFYGWNGCIVWYWYWNLVVFVCVCFISIL